MLMTEQRHTQSILWPPSAPMLRLEVPVYLVHRMRVDLARAPDAEAERDVVQPRNARVLAVDALEDGGYCRQEYYTGQQSASAFSFEGRAECAL